MSPKTRKIAHRSLWFVFICEAILSIGILASYNFTDHFAVPAPIEIPYQRPETPIVTGLPVELRIPALGIDTNIQSVGLAKDGSGEMGVPNNFTDVAWYNGGPYPGMSGSAVLAGHLNGRNIPKAVFYDLEKLQPGDVVEVVDDGGKVIQFEVTAVKTYSYNDPTEDIFLTASDRPRLNLITCGGEWLKNERLYNKRTVVFTELLGVSKNPSTAQST
jgi:sortase A